MQETAEEFCNEHNIVGVKRSRLFGAVKATMARLLQNIVEEEHSHAGSSAESK